MRIPIVLLLVWAVAAAQDDPGSKPLTVSIKQRTVREIIDSFRRQFKATIEVAPEYADKVLTLDEKSTLDGILGIVAQRVGGKFWKDPDGTLYVVPEWQAKILQTLAQKKLNCIQWREGDITLGGACQYLRSVTGLNLLLDESLDADTSIEFEAEGVSARTLLDAMAALADGAWKARFGVIHLATEKRLAELPERVAWQDHELLQRKFGVPFNKARLPVVVSYCKAASGVDIALTPKAKEKAASAEVTLLAQNLTLAQVLALTLPPCGLKATVNNSVVKIEVAGS